jgi:hypothetical protein
MPLRRPTKLGIEPRGGSEFTRHFASVVSQFLHSKHLEASRYFAHGIEKQPGYVDVCVCGLFDRFDPLKLSQI